MGMLCFALAAILLLVVVMIFRQRLGRYRRRYQGSFAALKIVLGCRHRAVKNVLDAAQLYLLQEHGLEDRLTAACADADRELAQTGRFFSAEAVSGLCRAETELNGLLRHLQGILEAALEKRADSRLSGLLEMLDAAENDVVVARRAYNRDAEHYNQALRKFPVSLCARCFGYKQSVGLIRFEDNNAAQLSRHLLV